jgi:LacI family transcriptional regulator
MRFHSLPAQVAAHLKEEIENGRWVSFLPGERSLAESLQVSRRTLTSALAQLQRLGVVRAVAARGHRILTTGKKRGAPAVRLVGLLSPDPVDLMRPGAALWVKDLQALMADAGFRLNFFHGHRYVSRQPGRALAKLTAANPQACWLLVKSSEPTQRWFAREGLRALAAGTCHPGIGLPDVDLDFEAMGRHVAARLAAHQHRRAVLFLTTAPGYVASEVGCERGFSEVFRRAGGEPIIAYHERSREGLARVIRRYLNGADRPTALVMTDSLDYLTACSLLAQQGLRVPQDLSVVARNNDVFMSALLPTPTCYHASPHVIARKIFKLLMQVVEAETPPRPQVRIMPDFVAGESLATASGSVAR